LFGRSTQAESSHYCQNSRSIRKTSSGINCRSKMVSLKLALILTLLSV